MRWLVCGLLCLVPASNLFAQQVGDLVIVKDRADVRRGDTVVASAARGERLTVHKLEGERLWVAESFWVNRADVLSVEDALDYFGGLIEATPEDAGLYKARGTVRLAIGKYSEAIDDLTEAIFLRQHYPIAYFYRGTAWAYQGQYKQALADLNQYILLQPSRANGYYNRANVYRLTGQYAKAVSDYERSIRLNPRHSWYCGNLAWLLATCPDATFRDGERAMELATQACELSGWKRFGAMGSLAAACAETGDFGKAVQWQTKAVELAPEKEKADFRSRLEVYKTGKPYREQPH